MFLVIPTGCACIGLMCMNSRILHVRMKRVREKRQQEKEEFFPSYARMFYRSLVLRFVVFLLVFCVLCTVAAYTAVSSSSGLFIYFSSSSRFFLSFLYDLQRTFVDKKKYKQHTYWVLSSFFFAHSFYFIRIFFFSILLLLLLWLHAEIYLFYIFRHTLMHCQFVCWMPVLMIIMMTTMIIAVFFVFLLFLSGNWILSSFSCRSFVVVFVVAIIMIIANVCIMHLPKWIWAVFRSLTC